MNTIFTKMIKIIIDTNFILTALKYRMDIFKDINEIMDSNYKLFVLDKTLNELKNKPLGKLALDILNSKKVDIIKTNEGYVDDLIVERSDKDTIVGTQDKELKKRLREKGVKIIILRSKKLVRFE